MISWRGQWRRSKVWKSRWRLEMKRPQQRWKLQSTFVFFTPCVSVFHNVDMVTYIAWNHGVSLAWLLKNSVLHQILILLMKCDFSQSGIFDLSHKLKSHWHQSGTDLNNEVMQRLHLFPLILPPPPQFSHSSLWGGSGGSVGVLPLILKTSGSNSYILVRDQIEEFLCILIKYLVSWSLKPILLRQLCIVCLCMRVCVYICVFVCLHGASNLMQLTTRDDKLDCLTEF